MRRSILVILASLQFIAPVIAQTWTERQQMINEKTNLEAEQFQQREEMERMQRENKRALEEQQRQIDQQRFDLQQNRKTNPKLPTSSMSEPSSLEGKRPEEAFNRAQEAILNREFVLRETMHSAMVFNKEYYTKFWLVLANQGFRSDDINRLMDASKVYMLQMEKAAQNGSAEDQRKLAIAYLEEKDIKRNADEAVKWFKRAAEQGDEEAEVYLDRMGKLGAK